MNEAEPERVWRLVKPPKPPGYTAPNPEAKDEINDLFAEALPDGDGIVAFLDHVDFKTATRLADSGVDPRTMLIPQMHRETFETMRKHPVFGRAVVFGEFNQVLQGVESTFRGIYADFTGPLVCGMGFIEVCKGLALAPAAVVAVTITLRDPSGNDSFTNSAIEMLSSAMSDELHMVSLRDQAGQRVAPITYGVGAPMVTLFKRRRGLVQQQVDEAGRR